MQSTLFGTLAALASMAGTTLATGGGETVELVPSDIVLLDRFGCSAALAGTTAIVGAMGDDDAGQESGSAYLFDTGTGAQIAKLVATDGSEDDRFGTSVAIHGTTAIVGAVPEWDDTPGFAYLFDTVSGQQLAKLLSSDGAPADHFGHSVGIHGTTAIVGASGDDDNGAGSGSAYLFDTTTGNQLAKLLPIHGEEGDYFGSAVAIYGQTAVVGARRASAPAFYSGIVYLFDTVTGQQTAKLVPADASAQAVFGCSVAIEGAIVLIGATGDHVNGPGSGSAYLFDAFSGQELAKLLPNDGFQGDGFGASVALSGGLAILGAPGDGEHGINAGAAYLFDTTTGQQIRKLLSSGAGEYDGMGNSVALSGDTALAGASKSDAHGAFSGAAYLFDAGQAIAVPFCFGIDGTPCPCGNSGEQGHGCANSAFAEGARLWCDRDPNVSDDDSILRAWNSPPHQTGLFFQGDLALNGGLGVPFGDGLRCAGTNVLRLEVTNANANGRSDTSVEIAEMAGIVAGDVKRYQWWYRDPSASPCGSGFNLSNGLEVTWAP